jgi:hypothetical protein
VKLEIVACLLILDLVAAGCFRTYTGIYFLGGSERGSVASFRDLAEEVDLVVNRFGFAREFGRAPDPLVSWARVPTKTAAEFASLQGSHARIAISVRLDTATIAIRDYDNDAETEFVKELKRQIEEEMKRHYGLPRLRFERTLDLFT